MRDCATAREHWQAQAIKIKRATSSLHIKISRMYDNTCAQHALCYHHLVEHILDEYLCLLALSRIRCLPQLSLGRGISQPEMIIYDCSSV